MSRELFRGPVPVEVTDSGDPSRVSVRKVALDFVVIALPAVSLSFTACDLTEGLFIVSCELTAVDYPALRTACDLKRDFAGFQQLVADLLRRAAADSTFSGKLVLPPSSALDFSTPPVQDNPAPGDAVFSIVEEGDYLDFRHLRLALSTAPETVLRRALSDRAKTAAADADRRVAAANAARAEAERRAAEAEAARDAAVAAAEEARALAVQRADAAEAAFARREEDFKAAEARVRKAQDAKEEAVRERDRLLEALRESHQSMRVADAVMQRQEEEVRKLERREEKCEQRKAAADVEVRKVKNQKEMVELELEAVRGRLEAALKKIEEAESELAMDQKVIRYLNRELNERDIARQRSDRHGGASRRTRRQAYVYSDDADDETNAAARTGDLLTSSSSGGGAGRPPPAAGAAGSSRGDDSRLSTFIRPPSTFAPARRRDPHVPASSAGGEAGTVA